MRSVPTVSGNPGIMRSQGHELNEPSATPHSTARDSYNRRRGLGWRCGQQAREVGPDPHVVRDDELGISLSHAQADPQRALRLEVDGTQVMVAVPR
jgi:hypothetical protein